MDNQPELLDFLKAMSDVDRLRIIGVLAQGDASRDNIASQLHLPSRDIFQHLAFLKFVGIVEESDSLYRLNSQKLEEMSRNQFREEKEEYTPAPNLDEKSRKVLSSCLEPDGTIKRLPSQAAQLKVILNYLVQAFTPGVNYTEKEVNTIIRRFHVDVSGLRRDLIDAGLLAREWDGSRYWRTALPALNSEGVQSKGASTALRSAQQEEGRAK